MLWLRCQAVETAYLIAGVIDQAEEAFAAEEELRLNREMEKEMTAINDDMK